MGETHPLKRYIFWIVIAFMGIVAFAIGMWGYSIYLPNRSHTPSVFDMAYVSIQLFVLESGNLGGTIPWQFELARFLAPLVAAWAIVLAFTEILRKQLQNLRLFFRRKHAVIIGFGAQGRYLASELKERKNKIVVIDQNPGDSDIEFVRTYKGIFIDGDAREQLVLKRARVHKAKYIISVVHCWILCYKHDTFFNIWDIKQNYKCMNYSSDNLCMHKNSRNLF